MDVNWAVLGLQEKYSEIVFLQSFKICLNNFELSCIHTCIIAVSSYMKLNRIEFGLLNSIAIALHSQAISIHHKHNIIRTNNNTNVYV